MKQAQKPQEKCNLKTPNYLATRPDPASQAHMPNKSRVYIQSVHFIATPLPSPPFYLFPFSLIPNQPPPSPFTQARQCQVVQQNAMQIDRCSEIRCWKQDGEKCRDWENGGWLGWKLSWGGRVAGGLEIVREARWKAAPREPWPPRPGVVVVQASSLQRRELLNQPRAGGGRAPLFLGAPPPLSGWVLGRDATGGPERGAEREEGASECLDDVELESC